MANFAYPYGRKLALQQWIGVSDLAGAVPKLILLMANSTAGTEFGANTMADLTVPGIHDGVNGMIANGWIALDTPQVVEVDPTLESGYARLVVATNPVRALMGPGSQALAHLVLVADLNDDEALATSYLLCHWDVTQNADFTNYNIVLGADGLVTFLNKTD